jgi:hypothetical protein
MTQEEAFNKIVLYFYLVSLNDRKSLELSIKASQLYQIRHDDDGAKFDPDLAILEICTDLMYDSPSQVNNQLAMINPTFLTWPENLDLIPWREFHKRSSAQERIAVVWINVLGISISKLAETLSTSEGTIRYRLSKGLSLLGQLNRPNWGVV